MQVKKSLLAIGFAMGLGLLTSHADATLWATGPIHADSGVTNLSCQVTNVSSATITDLIVQLFNKDGAVLRTSGVVTLAPNRTFQLWHLNYTGMGYCRITSALSGASQIRGNIQTHRFTGTYWEAVNYDTAK